jgi:ribonuclease HI
LVIYRIWTDGCCLKPPWGKEGAGGWAMVVEEDGKVLATDCVGYEWTNPLEMEMRAVIAALRYADGRQVEIFCDAKVVVTGAMEHLSAYRRKGWRTVPGGEVALWQRVEELLLGSLTTILWVPSHSGYPFNEYADELADIAARGARTARFDPLPTAAVIASQFAPLVAQGTASG